MNDMQIENTDSQKPIVIFIIMRITRKHGWYFWLRELLTLQSLATKPATGEDLHMQSGHHKQKGIQASKVYIILLMLQTG